MSVFKIGKLPDGVPISIAVTTPPNGGAPSVPLKTTYGEMLRRIFDEGVVTPDSGHYLCTKVSRYDGDAAGDEGALWKLLCLDCRLRAQGRDIREARWYWYDSSPVMYGGESFAYYFVAVQREIVAMFYLYGLRPVQALVEGGIWREVDLGRWREEKFEFYDLKTPEGSAQAAAQQRRVTARDEQAREIGHARAMYQTFYEETPEGREQALIPGKRRFDAPEFWIDLETARQGDSPDVYEPYQPKDESWSWERVRRKNRFAQIVDWRLVPAAKLVLELSLVAFLLGHFYARDMFSFVVVCGCILIWNAVLLASLRQRHQLRKHFVFTWAALMAVHLRLDRLVPPEDHEQYHRFFFQKTERIGAQFADAVDPSYVHYATSESHKRRRIAHWATRALDNLIAEFFREGQFATSFGSSGHPYPEDQDAEAALTRFRLLLVRVLTVGAMLFRVCVSLANS